MTRADLTGAVLTAADLSGAIRGGPRIDVSSPAVKMAGWPRVIAHPGLPQIRTCRITASGSSGDTFASLCRELVAGEASASPALLSAVVALTRFRSSVSPACFPPTVLSLDALLPSTGSFRASSPASTVLSGRYDFPSPVSPHFVAFAWRYHGSIRLVSCLPPSPNAKRRAWGWSPGIPSRDFFHGDDRISHVPGEPSVPLPCSTTPAESSHQTITM